ncbi:MAG: hypothetical protein E7375_03790 [Clostridiales bacterium]|nr:hypothetical protein [Clostridiales bacterium]
MAFLRLFDLITFDGQGNVADEASASNYLYLVAKYNQVIEGSFSPYFVEEFASLLAKVEAGEDFKKAKAEVIKNCSERTQSLAEGTVNDRDLLVKLNDRVVVKDEIFASKQKKIVNNLSLNYIINDTTYRIEQEIERNINEGLSDAKRKSKTFKSIIQYNSLMSTAEKVANNEISHEDIIKRVS